MVSVMSAESLDLLRIARRQYLAGELRRLAVALESAEPVPPEELRASQDHLDDLFVWLDDPKPCIVGASPSDRARIQHDIAAIARLNGVDPARFLGLDSLERLGEAIRYAEKFARWLEEQRPHFVGLFQGLISGLAASETSLRVWPPLPIVEPEDLHRALTTLEPTDIGFRLGLSTEDANSVAVRIDLESGIREVAPVVRRRRLSIDDDGALLCWRFDGLAANLRRALLAVETDLLAQDAVPGSLPELIRETHRRWFRMALEGRDQESYAVLAFDFLERVLAIPETEGAGAWSGDDAEKLCASAARSVADCCPERLRVLDRSVMDESELMQHVDNSRLESHPQTPIGHLLRFVRSGYQLVDEGGHVVRQVKAIATRSAGPTTPMQNLIMQLCTALLSKDPGEFRVRCKQWETKVNRALFETLQRKQLLDDEAHREAGIACEQAGFDVLSEVMPILDDKARRESTLGGEESDYGQIRKWLLSQAEQFRSSQFRFIVPDFEFYEIRDLPPGDGLSFDFGYDPKVPLGEVIRVVTTGIERNGDVATRGVAKLSLGPEPILARGIRELSDRYPDAAVVVRDDLNEALGLQRELPRATDNEEDIRERLFGVVLRLFERLQTLDGLESGHEVDPFAETHPLRDLALFLENGEYHVYPGVSRLQEQLRRDGRLQVPFWSNTPKGEDVPAGFDVEYQHSPEVREGDLVRVHRFGVVRRLGVGPEPDCLVRASVVVSLGERNALDDVIDRIERDLAEVGLSDPRLPIVLRSLRSASAARVQARRELLALVAEDVGRASLEQAHIAAEEELFNRLREAVQEFDALGRDSADASRDSLSEGQRAVIEASVAMILAECGSTLRVEAFPSLRSVLSSEDFEGVAGRGYERCVSQWSDASPTGLVQAILRRGLRRDRRIAVPARVQISRGPKPDFLHFLDALCPRLSQGSLLLSDADQLRHEIESVYGQTPVLSDERRRDIERNVLEFGVEAEAWARRAGDSALSELVQSEFDGLLASLGTRLSGLRRFGKVGQIVDEVMATKFEFRTRRDDRPRGEILEVEQSGLVFGDPEDSSDRVLVKAKVVVSSGPGSALQLELERGLELLRGHGGSPIERDAVERLLLSLEGAVNEREERESVDAELLATSTAALERVARMAGAASFSSGAIREHLEMTGFERVPGPRGVSAGDLVGSGSADSRYRASEGRFLAGRAPFEVAEIEHYGWTRQGRVVVPARVIWSRGPAEFLDELTSQVALESLPGAVRLAVAERLSSRQIGPGEYGVIETENDGLVVCAELFGAVAGHTDAESIAYRDRLLGRLKERGARIFPLPGEPWSCPAGVDESEDVAITRLVSERPAREVLEVGEYGVLLDPAPAEGSRVVRRPRFDISRGSKSSSEELVGRLLREHRRDLLDPTLACGRTLLQALNSIVDAYGKGEDERRLQLFAVVVWSLGELLPAVSANRGEIRGLLERLDSSCRDELETAGYLLRPRVGEIIESVESTAWIDSEGGVLWDCLDTPKPRGYVIEVLAPAVFEPGAGSVLTNPDVPDQVLRARVQLNHGPPHRLIELFKTLLADFSGPRGELYPELAARIRELSSAAAPRSDGDYQEAIHVLTDFYRHKNGEFEGMKNQELRREDFRKLSQPVLSFLQSCSVKEYIREGDPRQMIDREQRRLKIRNPEMVAKNPQCTVQRIFVPGFERAGQTIQEAVIEVSPPR